MTRCEFCRGTGRTTAITCPGGRLVDQPCRKCKGEGELTAERRAELERGEQRRWDRINRGLSLREEARRLGISFPELSRLENP